jgi:hypothetical protein
MGDVGKLLNSKGVGEWAGVYPIGSIHDSEQKAREKITRRARSCRIEEKGFNTEFAEEEHGARRGVCGVE